MKEFSKPHFPNLDGLRFLCFLSVFFYHSFYTVSEAIKNSGLYIFLKKGLFVNGNLGVNFFFVLSGFLITYLLLVEKQRYGKINLSYFWLRRMLKIWPLYFFCVAVGFLAFPIMKSFFGELSTESANPWYYLTFTSNFDILNNGLPDSSMLGLLWSVAIEEQFYFVCPILLIITPNKWLPWTFAFLILSSCVFRFMRDESLIHEIHSLSCAGDLVMGSFGALLVIKKRFRQFITNVPGSVIMSVYMLFAVIYFFRDPLLRTHEITRALERTFMASLILFIILEQCYARNSFFKMSSFSRITSLGRISYGLYCLHPLGILVTLMVMKKLGWNEHVWQVIFIQTAISLLLTIVFAKISYHYFEERFLKLKEKFTVVKKPI